MRCIKTGFYASTPAGIYFYGDAFAITESDDFNCGFEDDPIPGDVPLLLRICAASIEEPDRCHIELETWTNWFDEREGDVVSPYPEYGVVWRPSSTLIAMPGQWRWLGY